MGETISKAIFFMQPKHSSYNYQTDFWIDKLINVNEDYSNSSKANSIPCLYNPYIYANTNLLSNKIIIFFHGTGNDIGQNHHYLSEIRNHLQATVLGVEYPGYGVYQGTTTPEAIERDALIVYHFVKNYLLYPDQDIIVMGLSMGTGPASYLSSQVQFSLLVLVMPFQSWRQLAQDKASFIGNLVPEHYFNNFENLKKGIANCRIFLIHGEQDELIPVSQSKRMAKYFENNEHFKALFPSNMKHMWHDIYYHAIFPIKDYLLENNMASHSISEQHSLFKLNHFSYRFY